MYFTLIQFVAEALYSDYSNAICSGDSDAPKVGGPSYGEYCFGA